MTTLLLARQYFRPSNPSSQPAQVGIHTSCASSEPFPFHFFPFPPFRRNRLADGAPHVLEEAVALGEPVERVVALAHRADEPAHGVHLVLALDRAAVLVNLGDRDLDRGVVLGLNDPVGGAALPGDVAVGESPTLANRFPSSWPVRFDRGEARRTGQQLLPCRSPL